MNKRILVFLCAGMVAVAPAQVQLKAYQGKEAIGDVIYTFKVDDDGHKVTDTRFNLSSGGIKLVLVITSTVDGVGMPIRRIQKLTVGTQPTVTTIIDFKPDMASVVTELKSGRKVTNYIAPRGASLKDESEFWFVRDRPAPGSTVKFNGFSSDSLRWEVVESTYIGKKTLNVGGLPVPGHEIRMTRDGKASTFILDEKGFLLYMSEPGGLRLERVKS